MQKYSVNQHFEGIRKYSDSSGILQGNAGRKKYIRHVIKVYMLS